jgi:hypothetical protein
MKLFNNAKLVEKTPIVTTLLLEYANAGQVWRMWAERSAEGQSLAAWMAVSLALLLWLNFFRVCTPDRKWAFRCQLLGCAMNALVILTVIRFRYL